MLDIFTVAFFGHREIDNPFKIEERFEEEIYRLLGEKEYVDFLVGRDGEFDQFASSAVLQVRKRYRDDNSSLILVLPYPKADYLNNVEYYEEYYSESKYRTPHRWYTRKPLSKFATGKWLIEPI